MAVFNNILAGASGQTGGAAAGYEIERSLRFDSSASSYLNRTPEAAGNRKTWTWSGWVKRGSLGSSQYFFAAVPSAADFCQFYFNSSDQLAIQFRDTTANALSNTTAVFRDVSAWYHVVFHLDTTQSTATDRMTLWVNGVEQTFSTDGRSSITSNGDYKVNDTVQHSISSQQPYGGNYFNGYLADVHFIDGQALTADDFGEFDASGVWNPKQYTFGTNPNDGTTWSSSVTQQSDGGYYSGYEASKAFDGNLSTLPNTNASNNNGNITFTPSTPITFTDTVRAYYSPAIANSWSFNGGSSQTLSGSDGWVTIATGGGTFTSLNTYRAGDGAFFSAIEIDGYVLLDGALNNSFHLPFSDNSSTTTLGKDTSVTDPNAKGRGMDVALYTGTGSNQTIDSLGFPSDLIWIKGRTAGSSHALYDSVRGFRERLYSNSTSVYTYGSDILSTTNNGFNLTTSDADHNTLDETYVAWCWKAGNSLVTNNNGSRTSQVKANQEFGFSIVTYTSSSPASNPNTIGHGLNTAPAMIMMKARTSNPGANDWFVYHKEVGNTKALILNSTAGPNTYTYWNNTSPTNTVFSVGNGIDNGGVDWVAYCWSEIPGFSKFGSYTSSTNTEQKITVGFKPRFVLIKGSFSSSEWVMFDTARGTTNHLRANSNATENDPTGIGDLVIDDTGFTIPASGDNGNIRGGGTYIYAAFASEPGNNWALNNFTTAASDTKYADDISGIDSTSIKYDAFDGSTTTQVSQDLADGTGITFAPSTAITVNSLLRFYHATSVPSTKEYIINGGSAVTTPNSGWVSTSFTGSLTSLVVRDNRGVGYGAALRAIEIDGNVLIDERTVTGNDSLFDSPTNANAASDTGAGGEVSGNYATLNPLYFYKSNASQASKWSLSNGNLEASWDSTGSYDQWIGTTFGNFPASGKYYAEVTMISLGSGSIFRHGILDPALSGTYITNGYFLIDSNASAGTVLGFAWDIDNQTVTIYKNNTQLLQQTSIDIAGYAPTWLGSNSNSRDWSAAFNFGQRPFAYTAPTGYQPLTTALLDDPTIADGSTAMDVVTYSGDSVNGRTVGGLSFQPSFAWIKTRNNTGIHALFDVIRGTRMLTSSGTNKEDGLGGNTPVGGYVSSFTSDGFELTNGSTSDVYVNESGYTYVGWTWDGGSSTVSNTDGSITSSVRANASAGFSIVTYTGDLTSAGNSSIGHGLGIAPSLVISKSRSDASRWVVQHTSLGSNEYLELNTTAATANSSSVGAGTLPTPTSSVFYGSWLQGLNIDGQDFVAYCWAPVEGYSAFGSYTGNNSTDGPFVYTGFRPRFILWKNSTSTRDWVIADTSRDTYNVCTNFLFPNDSSQELQSPPQSGGNADVDILSNGFKPRNTDFSSNGTSQVYVWAAFAENPFKTARAR